jgi:hypothetical protein
LAGGAKLRRQAVCDPGILHQQAANQRPSTPLNTINRTSKWLHKVLGLDLFLFLIWMSLSGELLDHPDLATCSRSTMDASSKRGSAATS